MSLKKQIIVVNEYSVPLPGGAGSRGGTPGEYVTRYMARKGATETIEPIQRQSVDSFVLRYMAREEAVEKARMEPASPHTRAQIKHEMREAQGKGGVAFGYGDVSLSDEKLREAAADIQFQFAERGKTVMKTVISFDEEYLRRHKIIDPDFQPKKPGDYRGNIDQLKLRMAVMHGLDRMSSGPRGFDDLRFVGVLQVDTMHVHAHLAMVDAGDGQITKDGTQRGKLLDVHRSRLRRGIDAWLDENQKIAQLSSAVGYERRSVTTYIKRWAHEKIRSESLPQFILACLPEDRTLWRASSNDRRMRKPNALVTELVTEQLGRSGSPLPQARSAILAYANERRETEGLSTAEWQKLVDRGEKQMMERAVNGVYGLLRALPQEHLRIRTPMLEVMSMDYEDLAVLAGDRQAQRQTPEEDDMVSFGFRLSSYASRLRRHKERTSVYRDLSKQWERADRSGRAAADSKPLYDFYRFEEDYHLRLVSKYQHFLPFLVDGSAFTQQQEELEEYGQRLLSLMSLRQDASLQRMKDAEEAERLGREIYGQRGGLLLTRGAGGRAVLDERIAKMRRGYDARIDDFRSELSTSGLVLTTAHADDEIAQSPVAPETKLRVEQGTLHEFRDVKALDLHHLGLDFVHDTQIAPRLARQFIGEAGRRRRLLSRAVEYLDASDQSSAISDLPVSDVAEMQRVATDLRMQMEEVRPGGLIVLRSRLAELRAEQAEREESLRRSKTTALDEDLVLRLRERVDGVATQISVQPQLVGELDRDDRGLGG